jgi:hypothetical protein
MEPFDIAFVCLVVILVGYFVVVHFEGLTMGTPADLQKLVENMKRANGIVNRAANDAAKHSLIMDSFEKRLDLNGESMGKIAEYEKLMADMDTMGDNGGPALDTTFPSTSSITVPASAVLPTYFTSSSSVGMFNHTG